MTASDHATERRVVKVTPNEVRAARLQLVLDEKTGHETPEWIRRLAEVDIELPGYGAAAQLPQPEH